MESVNELLKLFMRQAHQERAAQPSSDVAARDLRTLELERAHGIRSSNATAQVAEGHGHD